MFHCSLCNNEAQVSTKDLGSLCLACLKQKRDSGRYPNRVLERVYSERQRVDVFEWKDVK